MPNSFLNKKVLYNLMVAGLLSRVATLRMYAREKFPITPEQYFILSILVETGELYQRQICEMSYKDRPNMTRIINILEKQELVTRVPDVNGRKVFKIVVTDKGKALHASIKPFMLNLRDKATENIPVNELETCLNVLDKMRDNLEKHAQLQIW